MQVGGGGKEAEASGVAGETVELTVGSTVKIHSLVASPEFNGALGTVEKYDASTRRWAVRIAGLFARRLFTTRISTSLYMHSNANACKETCQCVPWTYS
jgi:hypothetical protein